MTSEHSTVCALAFPPFYLRAATVDTINAPPSAPRTPTIISREYSSNLAATGDPTLARLSVELRNEYTTTPVTNPATEYARKTSGMESMKLRRYSDRRCQR